ncbi:hypothetical protein D9M68_1001050 [compost metagenome]
MVQVATASGAAHSCRSNRMDSTPITTAVSAIIQNEMVSVGTSILVRRSSWVPSAQVAAENSASSTPSGRPASCVSSCHSSRATPSAAALTPSQPRRASAAWNSSEPITAEKIGMV